MLSFVVEETRRVQDDSREVALARLLNLSLGERRIGTDARDAAENPYELKTTTTSSVGTGRDVGLPYLRRMRSRYLVAAKGRQTRYAFAFEEIYFLHPDDLSDWITPYEARFEADARLVELAVEALVASGHAEAEAGRLRYLGSRGLTLNNPKIPWAYVQQHGTLLGDHPELDLPKLVAERPLTAPAGALDVLLPTPAERPPSADLTEVD
jgi:hypothetical protein